MKVKEWIDKHKKLVAGIGIGTSATVGIGLIFKFVLKEDIDVDPMVLDKRNLDRILETNRYAAMDSLFDTLKFKVAELSKYTDLDDYLNSHPDIEIDVPVCKIYVNGERIYGGIVDYEGWLYGRQWDLYSCDSLNNIA